jgi:hypothetical protein
MALSMLVGAIIGRSLTYSECHKEAVQFTEHMKRANKRYRVLRDTLTVLIPLSQRRFAVDLDTVIQRSEEPEYAVYAYLRHHKILNVDCEPVWRSLPWSGNFTKE